MIHPPEATEPSTSSHIRKTVTAVKINCRSIFRSWPLCHVVPNALNSSRCSPATLLSLSLSVCPRARHQTMHVSARSPNQESAKNIRAHILRPDSIKVIRFLHCGRTTRGRSASSAMFVYHSVFERVCTERASNERRARSALPLFISQTCVEHP